MNKSMLLGRLTKNPEIRFSQTSNIKVSSFTLAVNRKFVKEGEERHADFINIVTYGKLADFCEKYLKQGLQICVTGRIQTRKWEDNNGQNRYSTEVIAEEIDFADSPKKIDGNVIPSVMLGSAETTMSNENEVGSSLESDDLPF